MSHSFNFVLDCISSSSLVISRYRNKMLKTIIRHGCRLRPSLNIRLSTSLSNRLHTLSSSNTQQTGQVSYLN